MYVLGIKKSLSGVLVCCRNVADNYNHFAKHNLCYFTFIWVKRKNFLENLSPLFSYPPVLFFGSLSIKKVDSVKDLHWMTSSNTKIMAQKQKL